MAVTFGAVSSGNAGNTSTLTISHTPGAGSDRVMFACYWLRKDDHTAITGSTVVFNTSESLTQIFTVAHSADAGFVAEVWRLVNPTNTTANVVLTASTSTGPQGFLHGGIITLNGVDRISPNRTVHSTEPADAATTLSDTCTSAVNDMVIGFAQTFSGVLNTDAGQTERWNQTPDADYVQAGSTKAGASSVTSTWTKTASEKCIVVSFSAIPITLFRKTLSGIGTHTGGRQVHGW